MTIETIQKRAQESYGAYFGQGSDYFSLIAELENSDDSDISVSRQDEIGVELGESLLSVDQMTHGVYADGDTWQVLLTTGGPAARVVITTDADGDPIQAVFEFQDWFEPWTAPPEQDRNLLIKWAVSVAYYYCEYCEHDARNIAARHTV